MKRPASRETLERLAEAYSEDQRWNSDRSRNELREAWLALRAETAPLRSRDAVNDDKLNLSEMLFSGGCDYKYWRERYEELAREETAPEAEPASHPAADLIEQWIAEPCGCEETEALRKQLSDIRTERSLYLDGKKSAVDTMSAIGLILREGA